MSSFFVSPNNFKIFNYLKEAYYKYGEYMLMPAILDEKSGGITPLPQYGIHKKQLIYRHISDITENDQDAILLKKNKLFEAYKPK